MKFPGILVLGLKIKLLKGEHNFVEFVGVKLCFVWNFKGLIKNFKDSRGVLKKDVLNHFGKLGWESRPIKKNLFGLELMFLLCLKKQSKVKNNCEFTNNLKLWQLNISRDFLFCKIIARYVVD